MIKDVINIIDIDIINKNYLLLKIKGKNFRNKDIVIKEVFCLPNKINNIDLYFIINGIKNLNFLWGKPYWVGDIGYDYFKDCFSLNEWFKLINGEQYDRISFRYYINKIIEENTNDE